MTLTPAQQKLLVARKNTYVMGACFPSEATSIVFQRTVKALVFRPTEEIPTLALDEQRRCWYNPDFVDSAPKGVLTALLLSEVSRLIKGTNDSD